MLSMSGGVVHLTSRLVFCFASAPLVLVKLLRDAPLVPVEGLHADEEAQLIAKVPFYCLLAHVMLFMFSNLPCVFWCAAHGGWDNAEPRTMKAALSGLPARMHAAHANTMECLPVFLTSIYCAHCLQLEPVFLAKLAVIAITCRVLYFPLYYAKVDLLRTYVFTIWFFCCVLMMVGGLVPDLVPFFAPAAARARPPRPATTGSS